MGKENRIEKIYRYPIKGLSAQLLKVANLTSGQVIPGDREYALARSSELFDPDNPEFRPKNNFLALVSNEKLVRLQTVLNQKTKILQIREGGDLLLEADLNDTKNRDKAAKFFREYLEISETAPLRLVRASKGTQDHSFSDVPDKAISVINMASIKELETKVGKPVHPIRFRGNIYFSGREAWSEFNWINRDIRIGKVHLHVFKRTRRCGATAVNPTTSERDINIPKSLQSAYGHTDLGIYAKVRKGGKIQIGSKITIA